MPPKQPTLLDLARMVQDLTRQLAATEGRLKKLEQLLSRSARAKGERLTKDEWLARRRKVMEETNAKRWGLIAEEADRAVKKKKKKGKKARVQAS